MNTGNLLRQLPEDLREEVFENILDTPSLRIERIVSKGHTSTDWYDQTQSEWVMVVQGSATIAYDSGENFSLQAGDYLNIPARQRHKVTHTDKHQETIWLAIHYGEPGPESII